LKCIVGVLSVEIGAFGLTLLSLLLYRVLGCRFSLGRITVLVSVVLVSQLLLWFLRGSGEVVLYLWEYPALYSATAWAMYSAFKAVGVAVAAKKLKKLGFWLFLVVVLQPALTGINIFVAPPLRHAIVYLGGERLSAVVADTRLRAECGYYCWPHAEAILFTYRHESLVRITMIGITSPLLLIEIVHNRVGKVVLLEPWHTYLLRVNAGSYLVETKYRWLRIVSGEQAFVNKGG
jgi:hypothetical protein